MKNNQAELLEQLMEVGFVLVETNLYLDTHPEDERALRLHNTFSQKYDELTCFYESQYGPLKFTSMSRFPWQYVDEPWPWDVDFGKCRC
ncbi:spore coat protein CotJB [Proteiniborus sp. MB09-C3]|uniref:spore coat protein CotJB n=1 Tax=Proteiniborus sp. MB09-C3 TaxID=3050072 RepID=UPI0025575036|nr:spore coat protein CotJB [Proteiniborus sp. MB09-C3]WIV13298.1 spore coat protein CotJB [Proteiniborus sp. MB09-C3]